MRAPMRDRRTMHWCARTATKNVRAEPIVTWGVPTAFTGILSQPGDSATVAAYGTRLPRILRITSADAALSEGMGIYVDASCQAMTPATTPPTYPEPDYTVVAVTRTPRTTTVTIERRGAYGG